MERPLPAVRRAHVRRTLASTGLYLTARISFGLLLALLLALPLHAPSAHAGPSIWLPTPPGEEWKILQGYGCGTHNAWDRYSLDLAQVGGRTYDAPVRAAADGSVFVWVASSGTLILKHDDGFYTQYTHMASASVTRRGTPVARGSVIGSAGDRGAKGTPHLHFTAFTAQGDWARNRQSVPLSFAEGYTLPDVGGCNQHGGEVLVSGDRAGMTVSNAEVGGVGFASEAQPNQWYNHDIAISFDGAGLAGGWSASWNQEPSGDAPSAAEARSIGLAASGEGLHTLFVRGWGADGQQTVATYGPIGYDVTAPLDVAPGEEQALSAGAPGVVRWAASSDAASGVAGYRVYIGQDPNGTSDWFVPAPEAPTEALNAGSYVLRVQPLDFAGNAGAWATVGSIAVR